jgi:hypothetical protein
VLKTTRPTFSDFGQTFRSALQWPTTCNSLHFSNRSVDEQRTTQSKTVNRSEELTGHSEDEKFFPHQVFQPVNGQLVSNRAITMTPTSKSAPRYPCFRMPLTGRLCALPNPSAGVFGGVEILGAEDATAKK